MSDPKGYGGTIRLMVGRDAAGRIVRKGYLSDSIYNFIDNLLFLQGGGSLEQLEGRYASPRQGLATTKIGVAIHRSAATGEALDVTNW